MMTPLDLVVRDTRGEVAVLRYDGASTTIVRTTDDAVRADLERWLRDGVIQWIGLRGEREQLVTPSTSPWFLSRVEAQLQRYGFRTEWTKPAPVQRPLPPQTTFGFSKIAQWVAETQPNIAAAGLVLLGQAVTSPPGLNVRPQQELAYSAAPRQPPQGRLIATVEDISAPARS